MPVEEPGGDFELCGVLDDGDDTLEFVGVELAGAAQGRVCLDERDMQYNEYVPLVEIDISFLANQVGVPASNTLDLR